VVAHAGVDEDQVRRSFQKEALNGQDQSTGGRADRAGIMSFLYMLLRAKVPLEEAAEQISFKYLHVKHGKTGVLDAFVDAYREFNDATPKPFLDWVQDDYDRLKVKQDFLDSGGAKFRIDQLLRRE
jgi:hypothetical protein